LYYPAFLDIAGRRCIVVGGGPVAERKALSLLRAGAKVKVISPALTRRLGKLKSGKAISHTGRRYRKGDLKGAFLIIAATDSEKENENISKDAESTYEKGGGAPLINVVDRPEFCSFIVPSVLKRGPLQIAVSTSGASPAMAKAIRKEMEKLYGPEVGRYLARLQKQRRKVLGEITDKKERERALKKLASEDVLKTLRRS
jgi:precorrin-2 dehydrogenase/sirohydrochlorin ferrochelatase